LDPSETFALTETIEYGTMGEILWGKKGQIITTTIMTFLLYGIMISMGIIAGESLR
jgi:amino acid permease